MEIKFAKEDDIPLILEFIRKLADYEKLTNQVVATEENLKDNLFGLKQYAEVIFAYKDNVPVGFAIFFHNFSMFLGKPIIYLSGLYVKPEFRNRGIGTQIMAFLARLAKERNCARLEWWVLDWNKKAIGLYLNLGAIAMDEWTVYRITEDKLNILADKFQQA